MAKDKKSITEFNAVEIVRELNDRRKLTENLLSQVRSVKNSRGANRAREFARLEQAIMRIDNTAMNSSEIENKVLEANSDFLETWRAKFPTLTKNELLLCCLVRMEFSNIDIAELRKIDPRSIAVSRNRLKNKLSLETTDDLDEFIRSF